MSINKWMDKQNVVCPYNGIQFSLYKKYATLDEPWEHYAKGNEASQSDKDKYFMTPLTWGT